jgi:hypothetical protein
MAVAPEGGGRHLRGAFARAGPALPSTLRPLMPTWIIDFLEEDSAQIEEDGMRVIHVPRSILPPGAREGDVLMVGLEQQRRGKREAVRVTITLDPDATKDAMEKSRKQVKRAKDASRRRDSGGDIEL